MTCQNCGSNKIQNFCANCGEKRYNPHSLTLAHLAEETLEGFSHFDNKFFRTLRTLFFQPGRLSLDFCKGVTVKFMKPVSFFLITNLLFFVLTAFNPFSLPLYNYTHYSPFTNFGTREAAVKKLVKSKMSDLEYGRMFNEQMKTNSKTFVAVFIPFLALLFALVFIRLKRRFGEHFIFATHLMCFTMWLFLIQSYVLEALRPLFDLNNVDSIISLTDLLIISTYIFLAIRRFYKQKVVWAIPLSLIICVLFGIAVQAYRIALFFKIIHLN